MARPDGSLALLGDVLRGRLTRRDLLQRAGALGLGASTVAALLRAMPAAAAHPASLQEGTPAATRASVGAITWALESAPPNIIPFGAIAAAQWWGKEFMYDSLLEFDRELKIQPALAESYETPDPTTYVFHLRRGVKFHDGAEMTAKDVKYSLDLAVAPPEPGAVVPYLGNIAGVEVVDDYTVRVTMSKVDPTLPGVLAWGGYTPIVPEGIYDRINVLSEGIGTGPYKLVEYAQDDRIVYTAFEEFWRAGVPCVKDLSLKVLTDEQSRVAALRSGEIDGATFTPDVVLTLRNDDTLEVLSGLTSSPRVIHFNTVKEGVPWRDARVRQAINHAVNRQEIVDKVYAGDAEFTGPIPPGYGDWFIPADELAAQFYVHDPDRAKQLLTEAGFDAGFAVTLQAIAAPREYVQIAEIVREQLKPLNIEVTVEPLEIGQFAKNIGDGTFDWASTARGMRGDPSGYVIDFRSGTSLHQKWFGAGYKNDELDRLYDEALATLDQAQRHALYRRIQELILTDAANLYTVQPLRYHVVRDRVEGMYVWYVGGNAGLREACAADE